MRTLLVAALLLAACHDSKPAPGAQPPAAAAWAPSSDLFAYLGGNSDLVFVIDVAALRKSPLWTKYEPELLKLAAPGLTGCAYDPLSEVTTITAGVPLDVKLGAFVLRGLDRDKTLACLHASKAETQTTVTFDGDFITLTNKSGAVNLLIFADAHTLVMQGSEHPTKETLTAALQAGAPLRKDAVFGPALAKLPQGAGLAFMSRPGSKAFGETLRARIGVPARAVSASLDLTDKVALHTTLELDSADQAAQLVAGARQQLEPARPLFERLEATADGAIVHFEVAATEAQIQTIVGLAQQMMGGGASAPNGDQ